MGGGSTILRESMVEAEGAKRREHRLRKHPVSMERWRGECDKEAAQGRGLCGTEEVQGQEARVERESPGRINDDQRS